MRAFFSFLFAIMNCHTRRYPSSILITAIIVLYSIIIRRSSDIASLSTTNFVTAAWASSSSRNQQYRTTIVSPFTTTTTFHHSLAHTHWGQTKQSQHKYIYNSYRGGNQDRKSYDSALTMVDTTATAETSDAIVNLIGSSGLSMENYQLLSDRGKMAIQNLIRFDSEYQDQIHVYHNWPPPGTDDENKIRLSEQVIILFTKVVWYITLDYKSTNEWICSVCLYLTR